MTEEKFKKIMDRLDDIYNLLKREDSKTGKHISYKPETPELTSWHTLYEEKQPKNDYEFIALVVYYLDSQSEETAREDIINFIKKNPHDLRNAGDKELYGAIKNTKDHKSYMYIEFTDKKGKKYYRLSIKGKQLVGRLPARLDAGNKKKSKNKTKKKNHD